MRSRMERITGRASITLDPMTVTPVTPTDAYLGVAEGLLPGAQVLAASTESAIALTLVCGHIAECLLKALLAKAGVAEKELAGRALRHDLRGLWKRALATGCPVGAAEPTWLERLSALHNAPFHLRYPMGLNGLVLPAAEPMVSDLKQLAEAVRRAVRA